MGNLETFLDCWSKTAQLKNQPLDNIYISDYLINNNLAAFTRQNGIRQTMSMVDREALVYEIVNKIVENASFLLSSQLEPVKNVFIKNIIRFIKEDPNFDMGKYSIIKNKILNLISQNQNVQLYEALGNPYDLTVKKVDNAELASLCASALGEYGKIVFDGEHLSYFGEEGPNRGGR